MTITIVDGQENNEMSMISEMLVSLLEKVKRSNVLDVTA